MRVLIETKGLPRETWLEYRKKGLGGSDASAVIGANKYKSPLVLYMEKTGLYTPPEPKEAAYWGVTLEDIVAQEFIKRYNEELQQQMIEREKDGTIEYKLSQFKPAKIRKRNAILMHDEHDFLLMNVDRLLFCPFKGVGILEVKTANQYLADEWKGDEVPFAYYVQLQHYLGISGFKYGYIAVLIGGQLFKMFYIERDDAFIADLTKLMVDFWYLNIKASNPPQIDGSDSTSEMYKLLYPADVKDRPAIELPFAAVEWAEEAQRAKQELKDWEERKKENENKLKSLLTDNSEAWAGDHKITWKANKNGVRSMLIKLDATKS